MKKISAQFVKHAFSPFSLKDLEICKAFKPNQIVRLSIQGVKKPRSLEQLRMYWALCRLTADNTENTDFNTPEKVSFQMKLELKHIDNFVVKGNQVIVSVKSISYEAKDHVEMCAYVDRAIPVFARWNKITVAELMKNVKSYEA